MKIQPQWIGNSFDKYAYIYILLLLLLLLLLFIYKCSVIWLKQKNNKWDPVTFVKFFRAIGSEMLWVQSRWESFGFEMICRRECS